MIDRKKMEGGQLGYCLKNSVAVLAYSPLALGMLTGKVGPDRVFPEGDLRRGRDRFSVENRKRVKVLLDSFAPICEKHSCSLAQLVIAWTTHQPGLTHALVGARNREQAVENAKGGTIELSDADLATMNAAVRGVGAAIV